MFVRPHQNQFRGAQADVQFFYGLRQTTSQFSWNKPVGTTFVYILLVGGGGAGDLTSTGGGTGSIAVWFGAAKNIPNTLSVSFSTSFTSVSASDRSGLNVMFKTAAASVTSGGTATSVDGYWASGFYNFSTGDNGTTGATVTSAAVFLAKGGSGTPVTGNYGYTASSGGYLRLSPIIVGVSSAASALSSASYGNGAWFGDGSPTPGMAIIASW